MYQILVVIKCTDNGALTSQVISRNTSEMLEYTIQNLASHYQSLKSPYELTITRL